MTALTDLKYTAEHEWIAVDGDIATIGITSYAAAQLGDVVFVELPSAGDQVSAGTVVGEIESTKSVGELYAPVSGELVEGNEAVVSDPALVNSEPFGAGWLIKIKFAELPSDLLDHAAYQALVGEA